MSTHTHHHNDRTRSEATKLAEALRIERYPEAKAFFLAGSIVRGEGTDHSDLDVVVVFDHLRAAYRESFLYRGKPVEAFIHDPKTLEYFFREVDRASGVPSLPAMVSEGIDLPEPSDLSISLKRLAQSVLDHGPPSWDSEGIDASRYNITGLIDDLRDPRSGPEVTAIAAELYPALASHVFRSRGMWSATGKTIPKRLAEVSPELYDGFASSFSRLLNDGEPAAVIALAEQVLQPQGGWLFEGYRRVAPEDWRSNGGDA